ncbi:MAG: HAD-IA family hydrolase [Candidatus Thorarchaeota archaeon]|nr:HAD-IA family hydrolase [Candidatus Thorarchaeota archaeon]
MFKALVLDLDGVIRHLDLETAERAAQSIGFTYNELMNTLWYNDYSYELLCGRSTREEWWEHVHKFDRRLEEVSQDVLWNEVFERSYLDRELIEYVRGFKGKLTTGILTNCDRESKIQILDDLGNDHPFDFVLSSSDLGATKPEPEAFNGLLDRIGVKAEQCVFFDDAYANVEGAQDQGIIAYYYEGLTHLQGIIEEKSMI